MTKKQQIIDKQAESPNEEVLQNMLLAYSPSRLKEYLRMMANLHANAIYKSQHRALKWEEIDEIINNAVAIVNEEKVEAFGATETEYKGERRRKR